MTALRPRFPRPSLVMLPNGLTLANLFFGIFAIVSASRGEHIQAGWYIIFGACCDTLDGRVARATNTGSAFGEELDSLVDAISFGVAPAMMMYFAVLHESRWDWMLSFLFVACAVMRLARFNIEDAGGRKDYFKGLPSPAAGGTLATYYWFSQTPLYNESFLAEWPWQWILRVLMIVLSFMMISNVPYPAWPRFTFRTVHGAAAIVVFFAAIYALFVLPREFFFPVGVLYVTLGALLAIARGLFDLPSPFDEPETGGADNNSPEVDKS